MTVFISYRRETTSGEARALFNDLVARLGRDSVFMDVDSIATGRDFRIVLQKVLESSNIMLVLIDNDWAGIKDERGRTRLENPDDYVRLEVQTALKRDIVVIPVLVKAARMPAAEQLPAEIRDLIYRSGFELSHSRWESDVREMVRRLGLDLLERAPIGPEEERPKSSPRSLPTALDRAAGGKRWGIIVSAAALLLLVGWIVLSRMDAQVWVPWTPATEQPAAPGDDKAKSGQEAIDISPLKKNISLWEGKWRSNFSGLTRSAAEGELSFQVDQNGKASGKFSQGTIQGTISDAKLSDDGTSMEGMWTNNARQRGRFKFKLDASGSSPQFSGNYSMNDEAPLSGGNTWRGIKVVGN